MSRQVDPPTPFPPFLAGEGEDTPSRVGEVLCEKYELVRKIGEGGMGEVYEARHRVLGRRFAVKLLHPELVRSGRMLRRFSRESLSASRIESDHVVSIVDCGHLPDGAPYYVMDYLRGQDLRSVLREVGQLPVTRAVRLIVQACRGLCAAHDLGLVHRDLKPENLFVERTDKGRDRAKILDFGVVQTTGGNSTAQSGSLIGTLKYMAPEQARGETPLDQRADLYSLGAILYECLAGVVPHPGRNAEAILFHVMNERPVRLRELRPQLNASLEAIVMRSLEREPRSRFQSADELADALEPHGSAPAVHLTRGTRSAASDAASLEDTRGDTLSLATGSGELGVPSKRSVGATSKPFVAVAVALLCGTVLHLLDRAWLLGGLPRDAKSAPAAVISARSQKRLPISQEAPNKAALSLIQSASVAAPAAGASARSRRPTASNTAAAARAPKMDAPQRTDDYRANLDWTNPYGPSGPPKQ